MNQARFHGCAAGLRSSAGAPIKKPWTIATTSSALLEKLALFQCPGKDAHPFHAPCAGSETKKTELYTDLMADTVHAALKEESLSYNAVKAMAAIPDIVGEYHEAQGEIERMAKPSGHRPRLGPEGLWCAMVTKTLAPNDPLARSPPALKAVDKELSNLRSLPAWDEANPREASDVAKEEPEAHFARIFPIIGIKHFEDLLNQVFKGRIVLSGDRIKTASGDWAVFQELGTVPSTMAACRIITAAHALVKDSMLLQSDCLMAYTQAEMTGPPTYIRLPKPWWPQGWANKFRDPVVKLLRALYGHPRAGDIWGDKLEQELVRLEFQRVEGWPSVYVLKQKVGPMNIVFVVYVDDLVMVGDKNIVEVIKKLRSEIAMDEPADLKKYLGCVHEIFRKKVDGETITNIVFNMQNYIESAVAQYREVATLQLVKAASPYAYRLADEEEGEWATPGALAPHAASLIMKLMYAARTACPQITTIVSRMSSRITRWTKNDDRRLHRVYCFLDSHSALTLKGCLSTQDLNDFALVAWPDANYCGDVEDTKSTSGFLLELQGSDGRCFPLSWGSKKQGGTARSTQEAEVISLDSCVATEVIPAQILLQETLGRKVDARVMEDNSACISAVEKGYSPQLRYLRRQHKVSLGHLKEIFTEAHVDEGDGTISLHKAKTDDHKGDVFTKELEVHKYLRALEMMNVTDGRPE